MNVQTMTTAINSLADRVRHRNISEDVLGLLSLLFARKLHFLPVKIFVIELAAGSIALAMNTASTLKIEAGITGKNWVSAIIFVVNSLGD